MLRPVYDEEKVMAKWRREMFISEMDFNACASTPYERGRQHTDNMTLHNRVHPVFGCIAAQFLRMWALLAN